MRNITKTPWKFDLAGQGEGLANDGVWLRTSTFTSADTEISTITGTGNVDHGWYSGLGPIRVEEGNSDLPSGLAEDTDYWVYRLSATTFSFCTSRANAIAGTVITIVDAGATPNYILQKPTFPIPIYVKNIAIIGDGTNDGTVEVLNKSGGHIIARAEIFSAANAVEANLITPIYDYVDGIYIGTLDATNAIVLVYHGR